MPELADAQHPSIGQNMEADTRGGLKISSESEGCCLGEPHGGARAAGFESGQRFGVECETGMQS